MAMHAPRVHMRGITLGGLRTHVGTSATDVNLPRQAEVIMVSKGHGTSTSAPAEITGSVTHRMGLLPV